MSISEQNNFPYLIENEDGYEVNFGIHEGENLDDAIVADYQYFDWMVWKADWECEDTVEIVAEHIESLRAEGRL